MVISGDEDENPQELLPFHPSDDRWLRVTDMDRMNWINREMTSLTKEVKRTRAQVKQIIKHLYIMEVQNGDVRH